MKYSIIFLFFISFCLSLSAQVERISRKQACQFEGNEPARFDEAEMIYGFSSTPEAEEVVNRILAVVYSNMIDARFNIRAADVPNAEAVVENEKRLILYNADFMLRADKNGDWVSTFILAHEIAHHFLGHTLSKEGSRPNEELAADQWAGSIMCSLGASLDQAQLAIQTMVKDGQPRSGSTHPPKSARIQAVSVGFAKARCKAGGNPDVDNPVPPKPVVVNDPNEANYQSFKKQGDDAFTQEKWHLAKGNYEDALRYKANDSYCKKRIATCEQNITVEDKKKADLYTQYKNDGDSYYGKQEWKQAKESYVKALDYSAGNSYCTQRIASCNEKLTEKPKPNVTTDIPVPEMVYVEGNGSINSFYMGKYEITKGQFATFVAEANYQTDAEKGGSSYVWTGSTWEDKKGVTWRNNVSGTGSQPNDHPVIHVSWNDAKAYCAWLSKKTGENYGLPQEAQWEYAADSGSSASSLTAKYEYAGSSKIDEVAWYSSNSGNNTHTVGGKKENALGLYDMSGNVWEWCEDLYNNKGSSRVVRGGSWNYDATNCRVAGRSGVSPSSRVNFIGFRLSRTL